MVTQDSAEVHAGYMFQVSGFMKKGLSELVLPPVQSVDVLDGTAVPYAVYGDLVDAHTLVFSGTPYSTRLAEKDQQIRLLAQQTVLGEGYCIVGMQSYDPQQGRFNKHERREIAAGSFLPLADRQLQVINAVKPRDDQAVGLYGYSMHADVAVETAHANMFNHKRGIRPIETLGVWEPARSRRRGTVAVVAAFAASGKELFNNVMTGATPALLQARNIDPTDLDSKKKHDKAVKKNVSIYTRQDLLGNLALLRGFASDASLKQLNALSFSLNPPATVVGRMSESTITPRSFIENLHRHFRLYTDEVAGDHSTADDLIKSAAFMYRTFSASPNSPDLPV